MTGDVVCRNYKMYFLRVGINIGTIRTVTLVIQLLIKLNLVRKIITNRRTGSCLFRLVTALFA